MSEDFASRWARLQSEGGCYLVPGRARFALTGADRLRYLNGQVSNDLRKLVPGEAMRACILSAKGKLDAVVWIWSEPDRLVVECKEELAEALAMRLERYIVADDVEVTPLAPEPVCHVFGAAVEKVRGLKIARLGSVGVDIPGEIFPEAIEATPGEVERLRIERGLPHWGAELGPDTLPAEAGLDAIAVDFHKGCYIGQEVVSRIKSVGHANRALRIFDVRSPEAPPVGTEFFAPGEIGRPTATVTSVYFALSSGAGLCYIRRGTTEGAMLESADGLFRIQLRQPACDQPS